MLTIMEDELLIIEWMNKWRRMAADYLSNVNPPEVEKKQKPQEENQESGEGGKVKESWSSRVAPRDALH